MILQWKRLKKKEGRKEGRKETCAQQQHGVYLAHVPQNSDLPSG